MWGNKDEKVPLYRGLFPSFEKPSQDGNIPQQGDLLDGLPLIIADQSSEVCTSRITVVGVSATESSTSLVIFP